MKDQKVELEQMSRNQFFVRKLINTLKPSVGSIITESDVERLIRIGVQVVIVESKVQL